MNVYRSVRARDLLELFFVSAVTSLLLVRFFLYLSGYPELGGGGFHIAHMLWGGLLMLVSISILLGFIGRQSQQIAALVGGAGFGVFIDEIGKFVTSDNDYFFKPALGIIYAIFVILYFSFSYISRRSALSSREFQLNALMELEEAVAHDMNESERTRVRALLKEADPKSPITRQLIALLDGVSTVAHPQRNKIQRLIAKTDELYATFWKSQNSNMVVRIFFVAQAVIFFITILAIQLASIDELLALFRGEVTYGAWLLIGESVSALIAALIVIRGAYMLTTSRIEGFELFRTAALINIFLTEFFSFSRIQFEALPGFFLNLLVIIIIGYAIHQERRLGATSTH